MAVSKVSVFFQSDVQKVWDIMTSLENYSWRSDLSRIEVISENQFKEYTKDGYVTDFTVTVLETCKRWEFDMENDNMTGHWAGIFTSQEEGTQLELTEEAAAKKFFMKPLLKPYLKKQQELYISNLRKALKEKP